MRAVLLILVVIWGAVGVRSQGTITIPDCGVAGCLGDSPTCPAGQLLTPNITLDGCCPGCKRYRGSNAVCSANSDPCQPGLDCIESRCTPTNATERICQSYPFRNLMWIPKCELDGTFSPVQCKGERLTGRCYCYSEVGKRIFGQQWWSKSENMTCACSRRVEELRATGRNDVTLHCTEDGNFDALQCDDGVCWCSEPKYGDALSEVVPSAMMHMLPCYNATAVGDTYLRKCDSALSALNKIRDEMQQHGTLGDLFTPKNCGLDGTYGEYQFEGGIRYCTWKDNSKIGSYMSSSETPVSQLNCYCARDTKYFAEEGYGFTMQCGGSGNYITLQQLNDSPICVDYDGFAYQYPEGESPAYYCLPLPI